MGRHSSPNQGPYYRSLAGWVTVWLIIASATGIAVWIAVNAIGAPEDTAPTASPARATSDETATTSSTPEEEPEPESPSATEDDSNEAVRLVTEGVTVQVLNGTLQPDAVDSVIAQLEGDGFSILSIEESSRVYSETTVFWSYPDAERAAVALAEHYGWLAEPKPANLSDDVTVHVVVGADEAQN